jgi:KDO2-lipid IV(A) lauroyltransferase
VGLFLRVLAALVGCLSWPALDGAGRALGWLAGSLLRIRRAHVEAALTAAGVREPSREARAMYAALGRSAFEFLWMARRGPEAVARVVLDPAAESAWKAALARGKGVVVAASHTGNWDLAACAMARDVELLVVTKRLSSVPIDRFWQSTRARLGVRLTEARGAMAAARRVLGRGGAVAMMIDQVPSSARHAMEVEFLGRSALADRGPATMSAVSGAPLVVAAGRRAANGTQVLHVLAVLHPPVNDRVDDRVSDGGATSRRAWIARATSEATAALDRFVRAYPSQWLWMHRRWKHLPDGRVDLNSHPGRLQRRWPSLPPSTTASSSPGAPSRAG